MMMHGGVRLVAVGDDDAWGIRFVAVGDDEAWGRTVGCCG